MNKIIKSGLLGIAFGAGALSSCVAADFDRQERIREADNMQRHVIQQEREFKQSYRYLKRITNDVRNRSGDAAACEFEAAAHSDDLIHLMETDSNQYKAQLTRLSQNF